MNIECHKCPIRALCNTPRYVAASYSQIGQQWEIQMQTETPQDDGQCPLQIQIEVMIKIKEQMDSGE
ncbi:MAG: hypothetical protein ACWGQW_00415 [bacterium]